MNPIKILIGGSPCQKWSICKNKNRETKAEGEGWELFKNYLIAKEKFKPDYFLYENNASAAIAIKEQISKELGVELQVIDSALVSAQSRKRFYAHNIPGVELPQDKGLSLRNILEIGWVDAPRYELKHITKHIVNNPNKPIRIGDVGTTAQAHRVYSVEGKSIGLCSSGGGVGGKTGLYLCPVGHFLSENTLYEIVDGEIKIFNDKLTFDHFGTVYEVRKITPVECERLQTLPDGYTEGVSKTQRYKCLGNGWTADVIIHILSKLPIDKDTPIQVLSMYDGIGTGRYCFDKLGYNNIEYKAYEIDKNAIKIATSNYSDIIECGNAFDVRKEDWSY